MKFSFNYFNEAPLHAAVIEENVEIVQLLTRSTEIDINAKSIYNFVQFNIISYLFFFDKISIFYI